MSSPTPVLPAISNTTWAVVFAVMIFTFVGGAIALADAARRGKSVAAWFLVFALTGPLGVAYYFATRPRATQPSWEPSPRQ